MARQKAHSGKSHGPPQERLLADALSAAANAILITDSGGRIVWANEALSRLSGYELAELVGCTPSILNSHVQSKAFYENLWRTIGSGRAWRGVMVDRRKDGSLYTVDETITPLLNDAEVITHFIAIQQDISVQMKERDREHFLAFHDVLTGLPNRALFLDLQSQAIGHALRSCHALAVLFVDLDKFKPVNDVFGHAVGDRLLIAVAERLNAAIRKSDTVARIGGDEFAVLLPDLPSPDVVERLAAKLISSLARPFMIDEEKIEIGSSIGIAIFPDDGETADALMEKADRAMYCAKQGGGNGYRRAAELDA